MHLLYVDFIVSLPQNVSETLLNYFNLFSPNDYKKNEQIIYKYFKVKKYSRVEFKFKKWMRQEIIF